MKTYNNALAAVKQILKYANIKTEIKYISPAFGERVFAILEDDMVIALERTGLDTITIANQTHIIPSRLIWAPISRFCNVREIA